MLGCIRLQMVGGYCALVLGLIAFAVFAIGCAPSSMSGCRSCTIPGCSFETEPGYYRTWSKYPPRDGFPSAGESLVVETPAQQMYALIVDWLRIYGFPTNYGREGENEWVSTVLVEPVYSDENQNEGATRTALLIVVSPTDEVEFSRVWLTWVTEARAAGEDSWNPIDDLMVDERDDENSQTVSERSAFLCRFQRWLYDYDPYPDMEQPLEVRKIDW
ncbi:MAG: hypothetical protein GY906_12035 [bacterium]|nr:hypothetical protein [bacterium]